MTVFLGFLTGMFILGFLRKSRKWNWLIILIVSLAVCFAYFFLNQI